jgi:tetratricopeptide (TPR) repeat protein
MKMIFIPLALSILVPALAAANTTGTPDPSAIAAAAERAIEVASMWSDAGALKAATRTLDDALTRAPDDAALLYTRGFAYYAESLSLYRDPKNRVAMKRCLDKGVDELERVKGAPWETEAVALEANLLGSLIGFQDDPAMAGATFGMKSSRLLGQAAAAAPGNPRVLLFRGTSLLFTPPEYGGDPALGVATIEKAVDHFASDGATAAGPHWGHGQALAWLGLARQRTGDLAGARAAWEKALALEPNYAWVKFALLPSLGHK